MFICIRKSLGSLTIVLSVEHTDENRQALGIYKTDHYKELVDGEFDDDIHATQALSVISTSSHSPLPIKGYSFYPTCTDFMW